jgi:hypothetical protein
VLALTVSVQAQVEQKRPDGFPYLSHGRYWFVKNINRTMQNLTVHSDMAKGDSTILAALHPQATETTLPSITSATVKDVNIFHVFENSKNAFIIYNTAFPAEQTRNEDRSNEMDMLSKNGTYFAILKKSNPEALDALVKASERNWPFCEDPKNFDFKEDKWIIFHVRTGLRVDLMNPDINTIADEAERQRFTPAETFIFFTKNHYIGNIFSSKEKEIIRWVFGVDVGEGLFIRQEAQMSPNSLAGFGGWNPNDFVDEEDNWLLDIYGSNNRYSFWEGRSIVPDPSITNSDLAIIYLSELGDRKWRSHFDVPPGPVVWLDRQKSFVLENSYFVVADNFLILLIHESPSSSGQSADPRKRTVLIFHTTDRINYAALESEKTKIKDYRWEFVDGLKMIHSDKTGGTNIDPFTPTSLHLNEGLASLKDWYDTNPAITSLASCIAKHILLVIQQKANAPNLYLPHDWLTELETTYRKIVERHSDKTFTLEVLSPASLSTREDYLQNLFYNDNRFDLRSFGRYTLGLPSVLPPDCYVKRESEYDQNSHTSTSIYRLSDLEWLSNFYVGNGAYSDIWKDADNRGSFEDFFDEANAGVLSKSWFVVSDNTLFLGIVQDGIYMEDALDLITGDLLQKNNFFVLGIFYCPDGVNTNDLWFGKRSLQSYKWHFVDAFRHASIVLPEVDNTPEELHLDQGVASLFDWLDRHPTCPDPIETPDESTVFPTYRYGDVIAWHLGQIIKKTYQNKANARPWNEGLSAHNWNQNLSHNNNSVNTSLPNIFQYNEGSTEYFDIRNFVQAAISNRNQPPPYYLVFSANGVNAWKNHFGAVAWNHGKDGHDLGQSWAIAADSLLLVVISDRESQKRSISYNLFYSHSPVDLPALRAGTKQLRDYTWIYIDGFKRTGSSEDNVDFPLVDLRWLFEKGFSSLSAWAAAKSDCPAPRKLVNFNFNINDDYLCPIAWHLGRVITNFSANSGKNSYYTGWAHNLVQTSSLITPVIFMATNNLPQSFFVEKSLDGSDRYNLLPFIEAALKNR